MNRPTREAMKEIVESFQTSTVLVIGDVMLDEYIEGKVSRISPEAPVPVVEVEDFKCFPGGAANTAANIASLGGSACVVGVVGCDKAARELKEALDRLHIRSSLLEDSNRPTTKKTRLVAHHHQVARFDLETREAISNAAEELLLGSVRNWLLQADAIVLSDYSKGTLSRRSSEAIIAMAIDARKPIVVDPKSDDFARYAGATIVTPNVVEAQQALRRELVDDVAVERGAWDLCEMLGGSALLLTRGPKGMSLFHESEVTHIKATAQNVFDVTGAGDTVAAVLAISLAAGAPLSLSAELANTAAGIAVKKFGTTAVQLEEFLQEVDDHFDYFDGVVAKSST